MSIDRGFPHPIVWDPEIPPGGFVCACPVSTTDGGIDLPGVGLVCGMPVESEPCPLHTPTVIEEAS